MERRLRRRTFVSPDRQADLLHEQILPRYNKHARLERVFGCTASSSASLAVESRTGLVAFPAGSTVVIQNPRSGAQAHLVANTRNALSCVAFSADGRFLASGETGHEPRVRVWRVSDESDRFVGQPLFALDAHRMGIAAVKFSPRGNLLVSVGNQHDGNIVVHDWKTGQRVCSNRINCAVHAIAISEDGSLCVTVGAKHLKFWSLSLSDTPEVLQGRAAILGGRRNSTFIDVAFAANSSNRLFVLTDGALLVEIVDKKVHQSYSTEGASARCLAVWDRSLVLGFAGGDVRSFELPTLRPKSALRPLHHLGLDVSLASDHLLSRQHQQSSASIRYADVRALALNSVSGVLTALYADRSLYHFQLAGSTAVKVSSHLFHAGPVHAVEVYPVGRPHLPAGTFITAGADYTIRFWNLDMRGNASTPSSPVSSASASKPPFFPARNVCSEELKKMVFVGETLDSLIVPLDRTGNTSTIGSSMEGGVKCLRVSPDGCHLAVGLRSGGLIILDLTNSSMQRVIEINAHNGDVTALEYSPLRSDVPYVLASGGRDRLVHLFSAVGNYSFLATIEDCTASVNAIKFVVSADVLRMYTCVADKSILIHKVLSSSGGTHKSNGGAIFERENSISVATAANDIQVGADGGSLMAACHDRQIRSFSLSGKQLAVLRSAVLEEVTGILTKVAVDSSGSYCAAVCSDRFVYVLDIQSAECVAVLAGQSEGVTAIAFSADARRLLVLSHNGALFIWRLSAALTHRITGRRPPTTSVSSTTHPSRCRSPDSLLDSEAGSDEPLKGGGTTANSHQHSNQQTTSSGSEFGSVTSVRIGDEDADSCLAAAAPAAVVVHTDPSLSSIEMKALPREVVRRVPSNMDASQMSDSMWELAANGGGPGEDDDAAIAAAAALRSRPQPSPRTPRRRWQTDDQPPEDAGSDTPPFARSHDGRTPNRDGGGGYLLPYSASNSSLGGGLHAPRQQQAQQQQRAAHLQMPSRNSNVSWTPPRLQNSRSTSSLAGVTNSGGGRTASVAPPILRRQSDRRRNETREEQAQRRKTVVIYLDEAPENDAMDDDSIEHQQPEYATPVSRLRQDSDMSVSTSGGGSGGGGGGVTLRSSAMLSTSHASVRQAGTLAPTALSQLSQLRSLMRKSQENLALLTNAAGSGATAMGSSTNLFATSGADDVRVDRLSRSRSSANLGPATALSPPIPPPRMGANVASTAPLSSSALATSSRLLARSVGSLHFNDNDATSSIDSGARPSISGASGLLLSQTMQHLKEASNPDLTASAQYETETGGSGLESSIGSRSGIYRKGGVAKRVGRGPSKTLAGRMAWRDSGTGEGGCSADSDEHTAPPPPSYFQSGSRSASAVESPLTAATGQLSTAANSVASTRRLFERNASSLSTSGAGGNNGGYATRAPSYLAAKLAATAGTAGDEGGDWRQGSSVSAVSSGGAIESTQQIGALFVGRSIQSRQMAKHVTESIDQFNTGLDKILHTRKLLEQQTGLPAEERAQLLRVIDSTLQASRRRLATASQQQALGQQSGRISDASDDSLQSVTPPVYNTRLVGNDLTAGKERRRMGAVPPPPPHLHGSTGSNGGGGGATTASSGGNGSQQQQPDIDAEFLQRHGHQLIELLKKNMAKQN